jgi:hypothetical protein
MWYLLQLTIIYLVINLYLTELAPHAALGHIFLMGVIVAYIATWLLTKLLNLLALTLRLIQGRRWRGGC